MSDELQDLIEEQRKDAKTGAFQRPEQPDMLSIGGMADYLDADGVMLGRLKLRSEEFGYKTGRRGRPRKCPHGDTYRKQKYNAAGRKNGTRCLECARIYAANWRRGADLFAKGEKPRTVWNRSDDELQHAGLREQGDVSDQRARLSAGSDRVR